MFDSEYFDTSGGDNQVMVTASLSMLKSLFGDENWMRFNKIKRDSGSETLQALFTWLLELGEERLSGSYSYDSAAPYNAENGCYFPNNGSSTISQPMAKQQRTTTKTKTLSKKYLHTSVVSNSYRNEEEEDDDIIELPAPTNEGVKLEQSTDIDNLSSVGQEAMRTKSYETKYYPPTSVADVVDFTVSADRTKFSCELCKVSLSDIEIVREHCSLRHTSMENRCVGSDIAIRLHCLCCDGSRGEQTTFTRIEEYVARHREKAIFESNHGGDSRRHQYVCSHCAKTFTQQQSLNEHVAYKHDKQEPGFQCPACRKMFRYRRSMKAHYKKCALAATLH